MAGRDDLKLSDAELDRRARELFAQVRAEHPEKAGRGLSGVGDAAGEVGSDMLGWLFRDSSDDDADGDDSGD